MQEIYYLKNVIYYNSVSKFIHIIKVRNQQECQSLSKNRCRSPIFIYFLLGKLFLSDSRIDIYGSSTRRISLESIPAVSQCIPLSPYLHASRLHTENGYKIRERVLNLLLLTRYYAVCVSEFRSLLGNWMMYI